jgi:myo-inositol-1(or 4)-monophosphatase
MDPQLEDLEGLARGAGEILRGGFGGPVAVKHKGATDFVTEMDFRSETYLVSTIQEKFPSHRVVTEESGVLEGDTDHQWMVDPLDGTTNYSHGLPIYAVSLAYVLEGKTRLGVVYDPSLDACFSAERGRGAWLNGNSLQVSTVRTLNDSFLVTGFPYDIRTRPDNNLDHYAYFATRSVAVRRLGSAALDLCYIAAGRFDGYWEISLGVWDLAAGALIVEEAGGVVTRLDGEENYLAPPYSILAGNPFIHPLLLGYFKSH